MSETALVYCHAVLSVTWASKMPPGGCAGNAQHSADSAGQHKGYIQLKGRSLHHIYVAAPASTSVRGVLHLVRLPALLVEAAKWHYSRTRCHRHVVLHKPPASLNRPSATKSQAEGAPCTFVRFLQVISVATKLCTCLDQGASQVHNAAEIKRAANKNGFVTLVQPTCLSRQPTVKTSVRRGRCSCRFASSRGPPRRSTQICPRADCSRGGHQ